MLQGAGMRASKSKFHSATAAWSVGRFGIRPWLALSILLAAIAGPVSKGAAEDLAAPASQVVLTVSGRIDNTNRKGAAVFDRAMLEAMPATTIETLTPWTDGVTQFEGPLARDLLKRVGARGSRLQATAINDYAVEIPIDDLERYRVILAIKMNGKDLRTRNKGPVWIIYPWSEQPGLRNETIYGRSIWQVRELVVKK